MIVKVAFIINGSRQLSKTSRLTLHLATKNKNLQCQLYTTEYSKHGIELVQRAVNDKFNVIIAVGGDGTCNEVVNGIQLSSRIKDVVFGIIPNGTGNDFQKMLGKFDPNKFVNALCFQKSKSIDLIKIESSQQVTYSLNISGVGFDGHAVHVLKNFRERIFLSGKLSYSIAILKSFVGYKSPITTISSAEFSHSGKTLMLVVCNGRFFGHGLIINPDAKIDDGLLNITLLGNVSFLDYLKNLAKLKKGLKIIHNHVHYFQTKELKISMNNEKLFTEADGEIVGQGNMKFSILPSQLKIIYSCF